MQIVTDVTSYLLVHTSGHKKDTAQHKRYLPSMKRKVQLPSLSPA